MRYEGKLSQWNDERGFGFITPTAGGERVFVHASAFARGDRRADQRPQVGDRVSFEVATDERGRKQARHVVRSDVVARASPPSARPGRPHRASKPDKPSLIGTLLSVLLLAAIGWYGWQYWATYGARRAAADAPAAPTAPQAALGNFRCDGRTHCAQMTSCEEAKFFLRNCPNTQMDGNRDGVPCEQQWCTSPWAK